MLEAKGLKKSYLRGKVQAVRGVDIVLKKGEILGVLGESGSGKSTLLRMLLCLEKPDQGEVFFEGQKISGLPERKIKFFRRKVQAIFQDPYFSLDPRMKVRESLKEPFKILGMSDKFWMDSRISDLLAQVNLREHLLDRYPHELSGGECQRVSIARALASEPEFLLCDEPVSSLDVLVRAEILNLFLRLQSEKKIAILFVSHDLRVIRHLSDRVVVMRDGEVCEEGDRQKVYSSPQHPYTRSLLETL